MRDIRFLSGNLIKILACIFMTFDHIGLICFPNIVIFRIIGRLAMPLFAYMISEGAYYTKNRIKYLLNLLIFGIPIQIVYQIVMNDIHMNIMLTFSCSLIIIFLIDSIIKSFKEKDFKCDIIIKIISTIIITLTIIVLFYFIHFDYSYFGLFIPIVLYFTKSKYIDQNYKIFDSNYFRIMILALFLVIRAIVYGSYTIYAVIACLILLFYNDKKGRINLKYFFYLFYPLHIVVIYLINYFFN